ncbi:hypothetical protein [Egbenema bharatensis]|uniref:hypothetical protein n=1 Tax=Egbenema bharatensis TaxID=3463334 RepID=UPI003A871257
MSSDRTFFLTYMELQRAHKLLHKALKAMETGSTDDEIKRLIAQCESSIASAKLH